MKRRCCSGFRRIHRAVGGALVWLLVGGCASAPPPRRSKPEAPPPPLVFQRLRPGRKALHELVFTPGKDYRGGLEIHFALLDERGDVLHRDKMLVGPIYDRRLPLQAGSPVIQRLARPEDLITVVGKPRPRSPLDPDPLDFNKIRRAKLLHVFRCWQREFEWRVGMTLPPGVTDVPRPGTIVRKNVCERSREHRDRAIERSFSYGRRPDPKRAWIDVKVTFNRDFMRGATFTIVFFDAAGAALEPGCRLEVQQPKVYQGQQVDYHFDFVGPAAVAEFEAVRKIGYRDLVDHGGGTRELTMRRICR